MKTRRLESLILKSLIEDDEFVRKVFPHLIPAYFAKGSDRSLFELIAKFVDSYNKRPSYDSLLVMLKDRPPDDLEGLEDVFHTTMEELAEVQLDNPRWLLDVTEEWIKDSAIRLAIQECHKIILDDAVESKSKKSKKSKGDMPKLLEDALAAGFQTTVGMDFMETAEERFDFYSLPGNRIPTDIDILNRITKGGFPRKTLSVFMAGTNVGKSLTLCSLAAAQLEMGVNVLYCTAEMSEYGIAERIDANRLGVDIDLLVSLGKEEYLAKHKKLRKRVGAGRLFIKEFPTSSATTNDIKILLKELKLKKNFVPDVIYVDYLGVFRAIGGDISANVNTNTRGQMIADQMRALAISEDVAVISAVQTNRSGVGSTDLTMKDVADSFATCHTADMVAAIWETEESKIENYFHMKLLKLRFGGKDKIERWKVGVRKSQQRLYDLIEATQEIEEDEGDPFAQFVGN